MDHQSFQQLCLQDNKIPRVVDSLINFTEGMCISYDANYKCEKIAKVDAPTIFSDVDLGVLVLFL